MRRAQAAATPQLARPGLAVPAAPREPGPPLLNAGTGVAWSSERP